MPATFEIVVKGHRDALGRFAEALDYVADRRREVSEGWGERMVKLAEDLSPKSLAGLVDRRKLKAKGEHFAYQWVYEVIDTGDYEGRLTLDNTSPYRDFVLYPTSPHRIPKGGRTEMKARGYPLRWFDLATGEEIRAWEVWHPGTPGNPVHERVLEEMEEEMVMDLQKVAGQVAEVIAR